MDDKFNTAAGWVLFSGIVALGASIVSAKYFHADSTEHEGEWGMAIEGAEEAGGEEGGPDLGTLLANADAAAGEAIFAKCTACHTIEQGGADGIGPNLYGAMGKNIASVSAGFAYSSALADHGGQWTWENMDAWLKSPRAFASGTKMSFAGLSDPQDRANVMEYLATFGGAPAKPAPVILTEGEESVDGAGEGPGVTEGTAADAVEAAGAMGDEQPVPEQGAATANE